MLVFPGLFPVSSFVLFVPCIYYISRILCFCNEEISCSIYHLYTRRLHICRNITLHLLPRTSRKIPCRADSNMTCKSYASHPYFNFDYYLFELKFVELNGFQKYHSILLELGTIFFAFHFFRPSYSLMECKRDSHYYSPKLLHHITKHGLVPFVLDILNPDVLLEPFFSTPFSLSDQDLKGELCNFLHIDQPDITFANIRALVGHIVLYQYPDRFSANYHLRFVRIIDAYESNQTFVVSPPFISSSNSYAEANCNRTVGGSSCNTEAPCINTSCEQISNLRRRSAAFRIWVPTRMYCDKMVDFVG